ncbi:MAG: caspase family protein [Xanthobacteraceae bacterium]
MSLRFLIKLAALASTCWLSVGQALAENRIALVIGNSNYSTVAALPNPANDAKAMAGFLTSAGFQVVQAPDLSQSDMRRTIGNFARTAAEKGPDTVVLVFYAGHGLQVDGENFLVPVDAQIEREADVPLQAMRLTDVMNALSTIPSKLRFVILDACRNNPFSAINKIAGRGLAIVDAPNGSLVSYSTAPGTEALDGDGQNSPYTSALIKIGHEPGLPIERLLKRVRLDVSNTTGKQQFPWESSSLTADFSFFPAGAGQERTAAASGGQPGASGKARAETRSVEAWRTELKSRSAREAYEIVVREDQVEAYQAYLALYPSQPAAPVVRSLVERRKLVVAWYTAVTINTVASYQAFLASYGNSDFAATAERLLQRASTRSISDAGAAFAAVGPTCPCSQPTAPVLRQRRTDVAPTQNTGSKATKTPGSSVAIVDPTPAVTVNPVPPAVTPPVIVIPPRISVYPRRPRDWHKPPRGGDDPKPTTGTDHPKPTGDGKGGKTTGGSYGTTTTNNNNPQILRGRINSRLHGNTSVGTGNAKLGSVKAIKPATPALSTGIGLRSTSIVPKPSFGQTGMTRHIGNVGAPRMSFGRMGGR